MDTLVLPTLPQPVDQLNQVELRSLITDLLKKATGRNRPCYGIEDMKPDWWPADIPWTSVKTDTRLSKEHSWTDALRNIVACCYQHFGQGHLLQASQALGPVGKVNTNSLETSFESSDIILLENGKTTELAEIPSCGARIPVTPGGGGGGLQAPVPSRLFRSGAHDMASTIKISQNEGVPQVATRSSGKKSFTEVFMCFHCEEEFGQKSNLFEHRKTCKNIPPVLKRESPNERPRRNPRRMLLETYKPPDKKHFIEALGLLQKGKAELLKKQSKSCDIDCEVIELEDSDTESITPKTPCSPRTPKSLMSQLSRDLSPPGLRWPDRIRLDSYSKATAAADGDSDSVKSDSGDTEKEWPTRTSSLLTIDISSLLGQRLKKNYKVTTEPLKERDSQYENYCHTPVKNEYSDRLRRKGTTFPVTFRKTRRTAPKHFHLYKFTQKERKEYYITKETGLNARGRALKKLLRKCSVRLRRVSAEEIKRLTARKPRPTILFPGLKLPFRCVQRGGMAPETQTFMATSSELQKFMGFHATVDSFPAVLNGQQVTVTINKVSPAGNRSKAPVLRNILTDGPPNQRIYPPQLSPSPQWHHERLKLNHLQARSTATGGATSLLRPGFASAICQRLDAARGQNQDSFSPNVQGPATNQKSGTQDPSHSITPTGDRRMTRNQANMIKNVNKNVANRISTGYVAHDNNCADVTDTFDNNNVIDIDDVISISSGESVEMVLPSKRTAQETACNEPNAKRRRQGEDNYHFLFRCHLCGEEIPCRVNFDEYVQSHFSTKHDVHNVRLVETDDGNGEKVLSIVEDQTLSNADPQTKDSNSDDVEITMVSQENAPTEQASYPGRTRTGRLALRNSSGYQNKECSYDCNGDSTTTQQVSLEHINTFTTPEVAVRNRRMTKPQHTNTSRNLRLDCRPRLLRNSASASRLTRQAIDPQEVVCLD